LPRPSPMCNNRGKVVMPSEGQQRGAQTQTKPTSKTKCSCSVTSQLAHWFRNSVAGLPIMAVSQLPAAPRARDTRLCRGAPNSRNLEENLGAPQPNSLTERRTIGLGGACNVLPCKYAEGIRHRLEAGVVIETGLHLRGQCSTSSPNHVYSYSRLSNQLPSSLQTARIAITTKLLGPTQSSRQGQRPLGS
jgi:hypothetical protein